MCRYRKGGHRLNGAARRIISERIMAGDSDNEVRLALGAAGHLSDVSRQAIWPYRDRLEAHLTLAEYTQGVEQVGPMHRASRLTDGTGAHLWILAMYGRHRSSFSKLWCILLFKASTTSPFIYFQF
jgi:hypothetical protein